jgi:hypothetical protein
MAEASSRWLADLRRPAGATARRPSPRPSGAGDDRSRTGDFPMRLKIEQSVCGAFLARIALIANSARVRSLFGARA